MSLSFCYFYRCPLLTHTASQPSVFLLLVLHALTYTCDRNLSRQAHVTHNPCNTTTLTVGIQKLFTEHATSGQQRSLHTDPTAGYSLDVWFIGPVSCRCRASQERHLAPLHPVQCCCVPRLDYPLLPQGHLLGSLQGSGPVCNAESQATLAPAQQWHRGLGWPGRGCGWATPLGHSHTWACRQHTAGAGSLPSSGGHSGGL